MNTQFSTAPIQDESELKDTELLEVEHRNHIFNSKNRFITYTSCNQHEPIYAGTTLAEVEGTGTARVTVQSSEGPRDITLSNALYIPTYQANLMFMARLQKKGAFFRPETGEIIVDGKHLCYVPLRGDHYVFEAASNVDTALATATNRHPRPKHTLPSEFSGPITVEPKALLYNWTRNIVDGKSPSSLVEGPHTLPRSITIAQLSALISWSNAR